MNKPERQSFLGPWFDATNPEVVPDEMLRSLREKCESMHAMSTPTPENPMGTLPEDVRKALLWVDWLAEAVIRLRPQRFGVKP